MYKYRVTKYNPLFRDNDGIYQNNEWTSFYDIINLKYSMKEYIKVENEYIQMVNILIKYIGEDYKIKFIDYEKGAFSSEKIKEYQKKYFVYEDTSILKLYNSIYNNMIIHNEEELTNLLKMILREYLWGTIRIGKNEIKFGYDYYMYFITEQDCFDFLKQNSNYIFVEKI